MGIFEEKRLYDPGISQENRLPPRATVIPALHGDVFYKNWLDSELILDLNGVYKFCHRPTDDLCDFYAMDFDDSLWNDLSVPSMWQYHGYSAPVYPNIEYPIPFMPPYVGNENPVGYYRKRFTVHTGGRRILYFGGVDSAYFVYLNGKYVGFSKGSRLPAEFDVTPFLQEGENLLCVKVFTYCTGTYLENQDMLLASGIFRDVMLYTVAETHLWDYCIRTEGDTILVDLSLNGADLAGTTVTVSADNKVQTLPAEPEMAIAIPIDTPIRWNAEIPHTYRVSIALFKGDTLLEMHTKKIGFAQYAIDGNKLLLNGQQITLKGINRHEHDPKNGRAVTVERIEKELRLIKSHNMNAIRCAHYPNNPAFYELCTELGIYVMNEADIETHGAHVCGDMGYFSKQPHWFGAFFDRVSRMYERDKNETCISIWTLGNENGCGENLDRCFDYLKSRPVKKPVMHTGDNEYAPKISQFRACGYFTMETLTSFPTEGAPVIMLEYGHAMGNSPGLMQDTWDYVYRNRHICGGYVWEFKNHGFYQEDADGNAFYQYGGDFGDINHWSNFSMDGYCLSDGTPKPSFRECKNVLAPTYVFLENGQIHLMNTNDFKPLDYLTLKWDLSEDYTVKRSGQMQLPPVAPYESTVLHLDTGVDAPISGAEYFVNLHFFDEFGNEVAYKQVSLGILKPKTDFVSVPEALQIQEQADSISLIGENLRITFTRGMLSYIEKDGAILLNKPMRLNLYRAPLDNDGVVGWSERWITIWNKRLYRHFDFHLLKSHIQKNADGTMSLHFSGRWAPISKFIGFMTEIVYTVSKGGNILVDICGTPYGEFAETLPRIGVVFPMDPQFSRAMWYGRGEEECYSDRCEHCNFGRYELPVDAMNFRYDIPQECGTRIHTRFLKIGGLSFVGSEDFSFSYHDFTLSDLIAARHRNELKKSGENYLYLDYAMRGLGSYSCGPNPEECYELRAHTFRFAFMIAPGAEESELLALSRKRFASVTEKRSDTYTYEVTRNYQNIVECDRD